MDSPFTLRRAIIEKVYAENENTKRFLLRVESFGDFRPGQFNMIYVYGQGEAPISISSIRRDLIEHTVRRVGEVTEDLFLLKEGDLLGVRGPFGSWFPVDRFRGADLILMAGGLGLAEIKPVVEFVLRDRSSYGRVYLLVGAKTPSGLLYRNLYGEWGRSLNLFLTVDRPDAGWKGRVGVVTDLLDLVEVDPDGAVAMMCGPEIMMLRSVEKLLDMGLGESRIYLSMERHMKCAVGTCGHCQFGFTFVCRDGPVFSYEKVKPILGVSEL
jgi:NAD(P)H-flavin reductase